MIENFDQIQKNVIAYAVCNSAMEEVIKEGVEPKHFPKYKDFAKTMYELHNKGILVSLDSISSRYKGLEFKKVLELLSTQLDYTFSANLSFYCSILKEEHTKSKFKNLLSNTLQNINNVDVSEEIAKFTELEKEATDSTSLKKLSDLKQMMLHSLDAPEEQALKTGIKAYDIPSGGCKEGKLVVIAGRPAMGKTAFALSLLEGLLEQNIPCGFISLEMGEREIVERFICMQDFDNNYIRNQKHKTVQNIRDLYIQTLEAVSSLPLYIDEDSGIGINKIKQKMYALWSKGCKVVCIDYLQLISLAGRKTTTEEIGEITRMLKSLAKKLKMTIFLLSQLSREVEKRPDKVPNLSDLRSSGDIEQDADQVIFLYRPAYYIDKGSLDADFVYNELELQPDQTAVIFDKNRAGETCRQICYFEGKHYKFYE